MSAHNAAQQAYFSEKEVLDPGDGKTIVSEQQVSVVNLLSVTAETRTLGRPTRQGEQITLHMRTDGGDITVTVTGAFNETGDTTFVFSDEGQFATFQSHVTKAGVYFWRLISHYGLGNASPTETASLDGLTATATELNYLDSDGGSSQLTTGAGVGITGGSGTIYKTSVIKIGNIIYTTIYIDLTGLTSQSTDGDIIGVSTGGVAHIGRITAAQNGTIESMKVTCTETPAGGLADIDIFRATAGTGVYDDAISGLAGQTTTGITNFTAINTIKCATAVPAANDYLYLLAGASSGTGTYSAGKFVIELIGY